MRCREKGFGQLESQLVRCDLVTEIGPLRSRFTIVADTAVEAEVRAKILFLASERAAAAKADALGIPCVLVTEDGRTVLAGGLA